MGAMKKKAADSEAALQRAYDEGFDAGKDHAEMQIPDPLDLLASLDLFERQIFFDRLKAEALRLGVNV